MRLLVAFISFFAATVPNVRAWAACSDFSWDVTHERTLWEGSAESLSAGTTVAAAPLIRADRLYDLKLTTQPRVQFSLPPGKAMLSDGAYAGLVRLHVTEGGSYRVSLDVPFWIDVVSSGKELPTKDFQGQRGCTGPHKMVEFVFPANQNLLLQFSGATAEELHVSVTRTPPSQAKPLP